MRNLALVVIGISSGALGALACTSDSTTPPAPTDGGTTTLDAAVQLPDASSQEDADTKPDADAATTADAAADADAAVVDANADAAADADAAPPPMALFGHIDQKLVRFDVTTGAVTEIGPTGFDYVVLAWDDAAGVARVVAPAHSPVGGAAAPRLGTISLCTGTITQGPALSVGATAVRRAEGLVRDPATGSFWLSFGTTGTGAATEFLTESTGTVNVQTGAVTLVGSHTTYQNDGDLLFMLNGALHLLDVAVGTNQGAIYQINTTSGAATKTVETGPTVLRIAPDPSRGLVFATVGAANATARGLVTLDTTTGATTPIGTGLPNATYSGQQFTGLFIAPEPTCP